MLDKHPVGNTKTEQLVVDRLRCYIFVMDCISMIRVKYYDPLNSDIER